VAPAEPRPGGGEVGVVLQALPVQVARHVELVVATRDLVGAQVELVGARAAGDVAGARLRSQGQGEGLREAAGQAVLEREEIAEGRLDRMGEDQRSRGRLRELDRHAQLVTRPQLRPHHHVVDVGLARDLLQVGRLRGEPAGGAGRAHDERSESRERRRDGVGEPEAQEVGLGVGARSGSTTSRVRGRATAAASVPEARRAARRSSLICPAVEYRSFGAFARALRTTRSMAAMAGEPVRAGGCSYSVACSTSTAVLPAKAGRPASISKRMAPTAKRSVRPSTASPRTCSGAMWRGVPTITSVPVRLLSVTTLSGDPPESGAGEAEVHELDAVRSEEHVRRLEVPVDEAMLVKGGQGVQDRERDVDGPGGGQGLASQPLGEGLALEQLHGDEGQPVVLADLVERAEARVVDARGRAGLAPEPLPGRLVGKAPQGLDGQGASELLVAGGVDDTHPAPTQLAQDLILLLSPDALPPAGRLVWRSVAGSTSRDGRASHRFTIWSSSTSRSCCESGPSASLGSMTRCGRWSSGCCEGSCAVASSNTALPGFGARRAGRACSCPLPATAS